MFFLYLANLSLIALTSVGKSESKNLKKNLNICQSSKIVYFCTPKDFVQALEDKCQKHLRLPEENVNQDFKMFAIIDFGGFQYKVEKDSKLFVNRLETEEGESFEIEKVLLIDNDGAVKVGTPTVDGAKVKAKVLEHMRGDTLVVFKKKRRKGYKVRNGHRQYLTRIQIEEIVG